MCDPSWAHGMSGSLPSVCQQQISRSDNLAAREGASELRLRHCLVLELLIEKRNTLVQSEIYFEHLCGYPNFDLGSESQPGL